MPLRDHFHPPLDDRHSWDEVHGQWPAMIVLQLHTLLPEGYEASPRIHLGSFEIDIAAFESDNSGERGKGPHSDGATTVLAATPQPSLTVDTDLPFQDEYEVRVYDARRGRRLVAAIEIVSPANKDRPEHRAAFVAKCLALLQQQVSISVVDLVTAREFNLYTELLAQIGVDDSSLGNPPGPLYAVTCRTRINGRSQLQTWTYPLAIGQPLPRLPLCLTEDTTIFLDLDASYEETCRVLRIP